jgi:uncharacterized protein (DUF305 family)
MKNSFKREAHKALKLLALSGILIAPGSAHAATAYQDNQSPIVKPGAPGKPGKRITPAESVALSESPYTDADVSFMQNMIVHHSQAVDMGVLIPDRSDHKGVRLMGHRIAITQSSEIEMMRTWLRRRGQELEAPEGHSHHHGGHRASGASGDDVPIMTGMLSAKQMRELAATKGREFDRLFLSGMILHHQGALDMVENLLVEEGAGEDAEMSEFLASIVADQSTEILRMQAMLSELGGVKP